MNVSRSVSAILAGLAVAALAAVVFSGPLSHRLHGHIGSHARVNATPVSDVAGFTKVGFTSDYMVIVNVLAGEEMFSLEEVARDHPTVGEVEIDGEGSEVEFGSRHVEAHIYDRDTGLALTEPVPIIEVLDGGTGEVTIIQSVLMQDVIVGDTDIHFGDNIVIADNTDLKITVRLGADEEVTVDGRLS
ncbi:MAG: hypothetical protein ACC660_04630 [Acidimicrobiales bacterium]